MKVQIGLIKVVDRARKAFPHIQELMDSIEKIGLLHPIVVHDDKDGTFRLLAGECRLRAHLMLGRSEIDVTTREDLPEKEKLLIELEENTKREDLPWTEKCELMQKLDSGRRELHGSASKGNPGGHSNEKLAAMVGASTANVAKQVQFGKMMMDRPDVAEKVKTLPMNAAFKKFQQLIEAESLTRQADEGLIEMSSDLRLGSCLDLIGKISDNSIDCVVTDPPYGIPSLVQNGRTASASGRPTSYKMLLSDGDNSDMDGVTSILEELIPELARVLKHGSHLYMFFCNEMYPVLMGLLKDNNFLVSPVPLIWSKMRTTHPFNGYGWPASYEPILFAQLGEKKRRLKSGRGDVILCKPASQTDRIHPFEKPQELLRILIEQSTYKGQVVLDPFAGSGATLLAAKSLGRSCIGFELNNEHYQLAQKRLMER